MKRTNICGVIFRHTALILFALICVVGGARAQSKEVQEALKITAEDDDQEADHKADSIKDANMCCLVKKHAYAHFVSADLGGSTVLSTASDKNYSATGLCWALSANLAYKLHAGNPNKTLLFSAGLELRNYNAIASGTDLQGATAYDNLHYWYAGIPVIFQGINTRYTPGKKVQVRFYGQAGATLGFMLRVNNAYSDQGTTTTFNLSRHYNSFMVQPFVSGGITIKTHGCTYMAGPYVGYVASNVISNDGITEHILSYGLRLTTLFLNN